LLAKNRKSSARGGFFLWCCGDATEKRTPISYGSIKGCGCCLSAALSARCRIQFALAVVRGAKAERDFDGAFAALLREHAAALLIGADPFFGTRREQLVALAERYAVPTICRQQEFTAVGGLISHGTQFADVFRQLGIYVGRILKAEKPGDLPVLQPTKFELVINLKTAHALGLNIPSGVLAIADAVIE
jgi:putative tryptophan/tyrosine transport system substrate-binding protein